MANTKKYSKPEYRLSGIELLDFHLYHENRPQIESKQYHFNINIEHKINMEKKIIFAITSINVLYEDKKTLLGSVKVACNFEVKNLEEFANQEKKIFDLPKEMLISLNSECISTTRGIMFANFSGTFLHKAYLPSIDPEKFLKQKK